MRRERLEFQKKRLGTDLIRRGWRVESQDAAVSWWADGVWRLVSRIRPQGVQAWLVFLVDPQAPINRRAGEFVWAVGVAPEEPRSRASVLFTHSLGRHWERGLPELYDQLATLRRPRNDSAIDSV